MTSPCEKSAQSNAGQYTLLAKSINYSGRNWPLYFMNEAPFNYTSEDEPNRHDMPYTLTANAFFRPPRATNLTVTTNTPNTVVSINDSTQTVDIDHPLTIPLEPDVAQHIIVGVTSARSDSDALIVQTDAQPYYTSNTNLPTWSITIYQLIFYLLLSGLVMLAMYALIKMYLTLEQANRSFFSYGLALVVILVLYPQTNEVVFSLLLLGLCALFVAGRQRDSKLIYFFLILLLIQSFAFTWHTNPSTNLQLLEGGDDTLTHEHLSRLVMKSTNFHDFLEAGQTGVFYFQPLYRYILGSIHKIFGESLWAPSFVQTFLLSLSVLASFRVVKTLGSHWSVAFLSVLLFLVLATLEDTPVKLAQSTYQEAIGLPLFILSILLTIHIWHKTTSHVKEYFYLSLLWGLTVSVRTNLTPTLAAWLIFIAATITLLPRHRRLLLSLAAMGGIITFPGLVILRNVIIAGRIQFLTTSLHPNLIDPIRQLFPDVGGASDLSFLNVIATLLRTYSGRWSELIALLWQNMTVHYVGSEIIAQVGWMLAYVLMLYGLTRTSAHYKIIFAILLLSSLLPMLFGAMFLHRSIAVHSQVNFLLAIILTISIAIIFTALNPTNHSTQKGRK
jgi:hypothetical protein